MFQECRGPEQHCGLPGVLYNWPMQLCRICEGHFPFQLRSSACGGCVIVCVSAVESWTLLQKNYRYTSECSFLKYNQYKSSSSSLSFERRPSFSLTGYLPLEIPR